jgi:hypothetical protein
MAWLTTLDLAEINFLATQTYLPAVFILLMLSRK